MARRGLFITVEGGEGVGKTTNIEVLQAYLVKQGVDLVLTREPGGTPLAEEIRQLLLGVRAEHVCPTAEVLLIFAARAQHLAEKIEPALAAGQWVICDRFTDATFAYQSAGRGLDWRLVQQLQELVQRDLRPDYTLLLDAPVATGLGRARGRGELDRFEREDMEFFDRVRQAYLKLAAQEPGRYRVVDASRDLHLVRQDVLAVAAELLQHCSGAQDDA